MNNNRTFQKKINILINIKWVSILVILMCTSGYAQIPSLINGIDEPLSNTDSGNVNIDLLTHDNSRIIDTNIIIPNLDFSGVDLKDALTALIRAYKLSVYLDPTVSGPISLRLDNVSLNDALLFIIKEYSLDWERTGSVVKIYKPEPEPAPPPPIAISIENHLLTVDIKNVELADFIEKIIEDTGKNIIIDNNSSGKLTGQLVSIEFEKGMNALLNANGFSFSEIDGIYHVDFLEKTGKDGQSFSRFSISCQENLVSVNVKNAPIADILSTISVQCGVGITLQGKIEGAITANYKNQPLSNVLGYVLKGTPYTYKKMGDVYFVGSKGSQELFTSNLIRLKHISNTSIENNIPVTLANQVSVKPIRVHNGLLITGPTTSIMEIEDFIAKVDIPPAQVLFDAIVVDYNSSELTNFNLYADNTGLTREQPNHVYYPNIDYSSTGNELNVHIDNIADFLNITNIGHLSDDFYMRLQFMEEEGIANIKSRPQIAALNGHEASINIGVSQYYLLESETVYPSQQTSVSTQTSQRFETIEADMSLKVIPWVTASGEVIVDIQPEFNTPAAQLDPNVPPTINRRILKSTVRLKDGETIVLGGMIQYHDNETYQKVPILGDIPILGWLFKNRNISKSKTELMVYITPHVYYGSEGSININEVLNDD